MKISRAKRLEIVRAGWNLEVTDASSKQLFSRHTQQFLSYSYKAINSHMSVGVFIYMTLKIHRQRQITRTTRETI